MDNETQRLNTIQMYIERDSKLVIDHATTIESYMNKLFPSSEERIRNFLVNLTKKKLENIVSIMDHTLFNDSIRFSLNISEEYKCFMKKIEIDENRRNYLQNYTGRLLPEFYVELTLEELEYLGY